MRTSTNTTFFMLPSLRALLKSMFFGSISMLNQTHLVKVVALFVVVFLFGVIHSMPNAHAISSDTDRIKARCPVASKEASAASIILDESIGSNISEISDTNIESCEIAGIYQEKDRLTIDYPDIHPACSTSLLETGKTINIKIKSLASNTIIESVSVYDEKIKTIKMAEFLPEGFKPIETNTVSTADSKYPIYIFFDENAGIMYFYSEADVIALNQDSSSLFSRISKLTDISGLSEWDSSRATNLRKAFQETSIESLHGLEDWDTRNVTDMAGLFINDTSLTDISALANWNTSSVTNMGYIFCGDIAITDFSAVSNWDTHNVANFANALVETSPTSLDAFENWDLSSAESIAGMFGTMHNLMDISALANWDTGNVIDMSYLFRSSTLTDFSAISNWDTRNVKNLGHMFLFAKDFTTIDVSNWDTRKVTNMAGMFNVGKDYSGNGKLREIIGLDKWDVSSVIDMTCMFYGAGQMKTYDIADWDVSKVESMNHMFTNNFKLEYLDLSKWNVQSLKTICNMFDNDRSLKTIGDISHWNTVSLIDAGGFLTRATAFMGENGTLDLSGWNTSNLKSMSQMFYKTNLHTIDLSGWTFDSITNKKWVEAGKGIYYSYGLGFGTAFNYTPNLKNVYISQDGYDSFNAAVARGVNDKKMWIESNISNFTVKNNRISD